MKNTYNIKHFLQLLILGFVAMQFISCSKFLDEKPISVVSDATLWVDGQSANLGVVGAYAELRKALNYGLAYYAYGDLPTDEFDVGGFSAGLNWVPAAEVNWGVSVTAQQKSLPMYKLRDFTNFYSTIQQANTCLKYIPKIPEEEFGDYKTQYNQYVGEAYFIRAFAYFYMNRVWGDVPIVSDYTQGAIDLTNHKRIDKHIVLTKAIDDCKKAVSLLSYSYFDVNDKAVRANKGAALALLAHMYAWAGDYKNCEIAANEVIKDGGYSYVDRKASYSNLFKGKSAESIFEIAQNSSTEGRSANGEGSLVSFLLRGKYLTTHTGEKTYWPLNKLLISNTLFKDTTDYRFSNGFAEMPIKSPDGDVTKNAYEYVTLKYTNVIYTSPTSSLSLNNIVVFRLAGIALLKAEAQAAQGKYSLARITLNDIRNLSGLGSSKVLNEGLFEAIITERARELFMEGHRFYDLVRLGRKRKNYTAFEGKISPTEFTEGKYYWPIQPSLILTNPLFTQTKYWQSLIQ